MRVQAASVKRKIVTLSDFRGVDYSSSPLEVKPYRATDMANLLLRDGVLHKRYGWEQYLKIDARNKATDLFAFGELFIARYVKTEGENVKSIYYTVDPKNGEILEVLRTDGKASHAMAYEYKGELFITDGTFHKLYYTDEQKLQLQAINLDKDFGTWEEVEEDGKTTLEINKHAPYVPTTTINVVCLEASADIKEAYGRTKNDSLNLLSGWRRNMLVCEVPNQTRRYRLDGSVYEPSVTDFNMENGFHKTHYPVLTMKKGIETRQFVFSPYIDENYPEKPHWRCTVTDCYYGGTGRTTTLMLGKYSTLEAIGELTNVTVDDLEDEIFAAEVKTGTAMDIGFLIIPTYFCPWSKEQSWSYEDIIITLTYFCEDDVEKGKTDEDGTAHADSVLKSGLFALNEPTIGVLHGVAGANDRLFLAGSSAEACNLVFYSENENLAHFPAVQQLACGDTNSAISALERLADGSLAVFKNVASLRETSIYYISGRTVSLGEGEEGNEYFSDNFSVSSGTISENGVSARSTINYDGDSLFASTDGVYAIVLSDNIYTTERYARERSRPIASKLKDHDLTNAAAVVYEDKYWLSTADGTDEVYVADSRYKYSTEGTQTNSYNYEWFRLTNIPAIAFMERGNELYFLSSDGWLCKFHEGFTDIYTARADSGDFAVTTLVNGTRVVAFNEALWDRLQGAAYIVDEQGVQWEIFNIREESIDGEKVCVFDLPEYAEVEDGAIGLKIHVAISAYWKSAILDLGSPIHKKNLWGISVSAMPTSSGKIIIGYKTRRENMLEGLNAFSFGNVDFSMFSFDCGGFINTFRQRIFERGLIYMQMMYSSAGVGDAVVNSLTVEYAITQKNIGIG